MDHFNYVGDRLFAEDVPVEEIARDIETALFRAGFTRPAFPTIVASGPNSAGEKQTSMFDRPCDSTVPSLCGPETPVAAHRLSSGR